MLKHVRSDYVIDVKVLHLVLERLKVKIDNVDISEGIKR